MTRLRDEGGTRGASRLKRPLLTVLVIIVAITMLNVLLTFRVEEKEEEKALPALRSRINGLIDALQKINPEAAAAAAAVVDAASAQERSLPLPPETAKYVHGLDVPQPSRAGGGGDMAHPW